MEIGVVNDGVSDLEEDAGDSLETVIVGHGGFVHSTHYSGLHSDGGKVPVRDTDVQVQVQAWYS